VGVCGGAVAVLEDLNADHQRPSYARRQRGEVAADELVAAAGSAVGELRDRGRRDVQAGEVQPACDKRQVVAAITAADVKPAPAWRAAARMPRVNATGGSSR
jgi:hypothetical protein